MNRRLLGTFAVLFAAALPASAQPKPGAAHLPVKQVVLFSSGVGYFQREGQVDGNSRVDLRFHMNDINDLLKSMILQDLNGGRIGTITYDNRNPIEMTLKSFTIDLTRNPSMGDLLNQARGEKIELVTNADPKGAVGQSESIEGLIVSVEKQRQPVGKDQFIDVSQVNMLTKEGLRGVALSQVQRVRFLKPGLDEEFRKALEVLALGHDKEKKTVSLHFAGDGKRSVRVGYVTENPIWKTSYRVSINKDKQTGKEKMFLQGWALVENTTDEDWTNVNMRLVSGRPISFRMNLYDPLFVPRPLVEPELFASLRPQTYGGDLSQDKAVEHLKKEAKSWGALPPGAPMADSNVARNGGPGKVDMKSADSYRKRMLESQLSLANESVVNQATGSDLGNFFQYEIDYPISLPRQKSSLIPIINEEITGSEKVSIFNENVHSKFPLLGLRFQNSTSLNLAQGPITLFEQDSYAGYARINDLQPHEKRLLSYAIDLGTEVKAERKDVDNLVKVKIVKGIVEAEFVHRESKTYTVKNRSPHDRKVLIEHPIRDGFKLTKETKPTEQSRDFYRFELKADGVKKDKTSKPVTYTVVEELPRKHQLVLSNSTDDTVKFLFESNATSEKAKQAIKKALQMKVKVAKAKDDIRKEELAVKVIEQEQARIRANMKEVPNTEDLFKEYLAKLKKQETEMEKLRKNIVALQDKADGLMAEFEDYVANLNID